MLIALTKNYDMFVEDGLAKNYKKFITGYIGIAIYLGLIFGHKSVTKSRGFKPCEVDLFTGKYIIDREEEAFLAHQAALRDTITRAGSTRLHFIVVLISPTNLSDEEEGITRGVLPSTRLSFTMFAIQRQIVLESSCSCLYMCHAYASGD